MKSSWGLVRNLLREACCTQWPAACESPSYKTCIRQLSLLAKAACLHLPACRCHIRWACFKYPLIPEASNYPVLPAVQLRV